jgi:diaminopimelate epimerase
MHIGWKIEQLMKINFHKMHGFGNDFVIVENFIELNAKQIKFICDRNYGIGCDQLLFVEYSEKFCEMRTCNADGSKAKFCGNGARCLIGLGFLTGRFTENDDILIKNNDDLLKAKIKNGVFVSINLGVPKIFIQNFYNFPCLAKNVPLIEGHFIDVGNPHLSIFVQDFDFDILNLGQRIQSDKIKFPDGVNVNFVRVYSNDLIEIRTFERGVGLTNACGSGASASAFATYKSGLVKHNKVTVRFTSSEDYLIVEINQLNEIIMIGNFDYVFNGVIEI